jgi:hypothetical protein
MPMGSTFNIRGSHPGGLERLARGTKEDKREKF